eukprot:1178350-Prorocentrum_minimum.AAC.2
MGRVIERKCRALALALMMSSEAPFPKASSMLASFFTKETRMGAREVPSRSKRPFANAAAVICTRP